MLFFTLNLALAGAPECVQCCKNAGMASCPTQLKIHGENSAVTMANGRYQLKGFWVLECDGSSLFLPENTISVPKSPVAGEILLLNAPDTVVNCFEENCRLPPGACISELDGRQTLINCASKAPLSAAQFGLGAPAYVTRNNNATQTVVIGGQTMQAEILDPQASVLYIPNSSRKLTLPPSPTKDCRTSEADRTAALKRVEQGDRFRMQQLFSQAASEYEAALAIDPCNGLAWSSVGQLAVETQQMNVAIQALKTYPIAPQPLWCMDSNG